MMKPRAFAGAVNSAKEVIVPVSYNEHDGALIWLRVQKSEAKEIADAARELAEETGQEIEIDAVVDDAGVLIIDPTVGGTLEDEGPGEGEGGEEEEEEEEEEEPGEAAN